MVKKINKNKGLLMPKQKQRPKKTGTELLITIKHLILVFVS